MKSNQIINQAIAPINICDCGNKFSTALRKRTKCLECKPISLKELHQLMTYQVAHVVEVLACGKTVLIT